MLPHRSPHVETLRKSGPKYPVEASSDFKAGVLKRNHDAVVSAISSEHERVPAGLEHAERLAPELDAGDAVIPGFPHEREAVRRVADDGVDALRVQLAHPVAAVAEKDQRAPSGAISLAGAVGNHVALMGVLLFCGTNSTPTAGIRGGFLCAG